MPKQTSKHDFQENNRREKEFVIIFGRIVVGVMGLMVLLLVADFFKLPISNTGRWYISIVVALLCGLSSIFNFSTGEVEQEKKYKLKGFAAIVLVILLVMKVTNTESTFLFDSPNKTNNTPEQSLYDYYGLIDEDKCEQAWEYFSVEYQNSHRKADYMDWCGNYVRTAKVVPVEEILNKDGRADIIADVNFIVQGDESCNYKILFHLIWSSESEKWLIEDVEDAGTINKC